MSTAVAEPPPENKETPEAAKVEEAKKEPEKRADAFEDLKIQLPDHVRTITPATTPTEEKKADPAPVADPKVDPKASMKPNTRQAFEEMERREAEAKERASKFEQELQKEREERQKAQEVVRQAEAYKAKVAQLEEEHRKKDELVRVAALERSPEFVAEFVEGRKSRVGEMKKLALEAGATEAEFQRAFDYMDEEKLGEWREALRPGLRYEWDGHRQGIAELDFRAKQKRANADETWKAIEQRRQESAQQELAQLQTENRRTAEAVLERIFSQDGLKDDSELREQVRSTLNSVIEGKDANGAWDTQRLLANVGFVNVQAKVLQAQDITLKANAEELAKKDELIAEKDKKIAELEEFVRARAGSIPNGETTSVTGEKPGLTNALSDLQIRLPDGRLV